eukprot:3889658-Lingulodinium_polyedra.AAC.1
MQAEQAMATARTCRHVAEAPPEDVLRCAERRALCGSIYACARGPGRDGFDDLAQHETANATAAVWVWLPEAL